MNFFENDCALPVIIGNNKEAISIANILRENTDHKVHIFAPRLPFLERLIFKHHKCDSMYDDIFLLSLTDFADNLHEKYMPILIFCDDAAWLFVEKNFNTLEQRYIIVSSKITKNYFLEAGEGNED